MYNAKQHGKNNDRSTQAGLNVHPFELDDATLFGRVAENQDHVITRP
jgi:hypothetical protein